MAEPRFVRSGLGDEIDPDPRVQLAVLADAGFSHLELRAMEGTNVIDLTDEQLDRLESLLDARDVSISAVASPIGKVDVSEPFDPHRERFERALAVANRFDVDFVRIFSYYYPAGDDPTDWRGEIVRRMRIKTELAEAADVTLILENERDIYGDTPERVLDLLETVDSPHLRALFDPANFVLVGVDAYPDAYELLSDYVAYLHVKDARAGGDPEIRVAGKGDARFSELIAAMAADGYDGYASLEPHLVHAGRSSGFSGPDGFKRAATALTTLLEDAGVAYE